MAACTSLLFTVNLPATAKEPAVKRHRAERRAERATLATKQSTMSYNPEDMLNLEKRTGIKNAEVDDFLRKV